MAGLDITDYHIDSLARFVGPEHVVANLPAQLDTYDPFHIAAAETIAILRDRVVTVNVIKAPTKPRVRDLDFVASYVNHYICNGAIVLAEFGDKDSDQRAAACMRTAYPNREVIQINVDALGNWAIAFTAPRNRYPRKEINSFTANSFQNLHETTCFRI